MTKEVKTKGLVNTTVNVLGTEYKIIYKSYNDEPDFKKREASGLCDVVSKEITICKIDTCPDFENITQEYALRSMKETVRHEITHAFLHESGLGEDSHSTGDCGWAVDEEIVDWFAIQSPKIFKVFEEVGVL